MQSSGNAICGCKQQAEQAEHGNKVDFHLCSFPKATVNNTFTSTMQGKIDQSEICNQDSATIYYLEHTMRLLLEANVKVGLPLYLW